MTLAVPSNQGASEDERGRRWMYRGSAFGSWLGHPHLSVTTKIGAIFVALSMTFCGLLFVNSYLVSQLIGTSAMINKAGSERMRVYRVAYLLLQLSSSPVSVDAREAIRDEITQWEMVFERLRHGNANDSLANDASPDILHRLEDIETRWARQFRPTLEKAMVASASDRGLASREYLKQADEFVTALSGLVQALEERSARRIKMLYGVQLLFLLIVLGCGIMAVALLQRVILNPLQKLTAGAEQLAAGDLTTSIPVHASDELGQLARTFEKMAAHVREKIGQIEALHATGQEIATLGATPGGGGLDQQLHRIADRAADLVGADLAIFLVRHPIMECWVVEAISGAAFNAVRQEILLFEEAPFSNEAFETKRPVVVADLSVHGDKPIRIREQFGAKSGMAVPLLGLHECNGVMVLLSTTRLRTFTEWEIRLAQQFASYAAITIENVRLFDAVESRSHALQEKLMAVEKNVAELTHEVKAPAGRVAEFASWIARDYGASLDEKALRYLGWIKKEGGDLANLAERTLDLARLVREPSPLESVDANAVVREVLDLLGEQCAQKKILVIVANGLPHFACRRVHFKQVLENLIGNAIKYMGTQPEPRIEIGFAQDRHGRGLYIRDNGVGIDVAMVDRIFQPFQRLGVVEVPGAGLGLSIVKTVVQQYGGTVDVTSKPNVGSTFFVRLPVLEDRLSGDPGVSKAGGEIA